MRRTIGWAVLGLVLAAAAPAGAIGPALTTSVADLDRAVRCPPTFSGAHEPVLFVHGTAGRAEDHWALGYSKILPDLGFDVCTVRLPQLALGDIQIASEYVVHAVRRSRSGRARRWTWSATARAASSRAGRSSTGSTCSTRSTTSVTLASPHHGAFSPDGLCATGSCHPRRLADEEPARASSRR
jgi:hypothetical protein